MENYLAVMINELEKCHEGGKNETLVDRGLGGKCAKAIGPRGEGEPMKERKKKGFGSLASARVSARR